MKQQSQNGLSVSLEKISVYMVLVRPFPWTVFVHVCCVHVGAKGLEASILLTAH